MNPEARFLLQRESAAAVPPTALQLHSVDDSPELLSAAVRARTGGCIRWSLIMENRCWIRSEVSCKVVQLYPIAD
jgi:hypothetical protein